MRFKFTFIFLLFFGSSFAQWLKVEELPGEDIFSLYHNGNTLYAGGKNKIYYSNNNGGTWDSTSIIPKFRSVNNIIIFKDALFATSFSDGVNKSADNGKTWVNISKGIFTEISDLCEFRGRLYATTLGGSIFKLNEVSGNNWSAFSNGLSSVSSNTLSIAANSHSMIAGTIANGLYDYLDENETTWEERFLLGRISANESVTDIITANDSLFISGSTGTCYLSTDNGLNWKEFGSIFPSAASTLLNTKQALILSRGNFTGVNNVLFYYIKKDSLQFPFVPFSVQLNHFTFQTSIFAGKIWDASNRGLFYMGLNKLPGITSAEDSIDRKVPVRFTYFEAICNEAQADLSWKTSVFKNHGYFDIETSNDAVHWLSIGNVSFTDRDNATGYHFKYKPVEKDNFYRIVMYGLNEQVQFSEVIKTFCDIKDRMKIMPNPVLNIATIEISSREDAPVFLRVYDKNGSLVKSQQARLQTGVNHLYLDITRVPAGVYILQAEWNHGRINKSVKLLKE